MGDDGNTLEIQGQSGQTKVVTASLTNSLSATAKWKVAGLTIKLSPGADNFRYVITDEPRMPVITATAIGAGGAASISKWEGSVVFRASGCPPFGPNALETIFRFSHAGGKKISDFFGSVVRGGWGALSAEGKVSGCPVFAGAEFRLVGTNPQQTDIQDVIGSALQDAIRDALPGAIRDALQDALQNRTLQRIACKESGQRQFDAPPNGGTGFCPLFGPGGKVGVMQIADPTDDEVWNWRLNVAKGIERFREIVKVAEDYPKQIKRSEVFKGLVFQFNKRRQQQGLKRLHSVVIPPLGLRRLELDAIRGYNGWHGGPDRFGLPLHEFRVAVDVIDGEKVLAVTNINEQTLQGEAVWERVPVTERPADKGNPNYVEEVVSFLADCSPARVTPQPCGATLRFLDFRNLVIDTNVQALAVSNHVSNDPALQGLQIIWFNTHATDRSAFRLEVEDSTAGASVEVVLRVAGRDPTTYQLNAKSGNRLRGPFLRLVTDTEDELSLPTSQNIHCALGEKIVLSYRKPPPDYCEDRHEIGIGRPVQENNNDHPSHLRHDIRELKLNVVVFSTTGGTTLDGAISASRKTIKVKGLADAHDAGFIQIDNEFIRYTARSVGSRTFRHCVRGTEGTVATAHADGAHVLYSTTTPAETRTGVTVDLDTVDERFAQSGIRTRKPVTINLGGPGDPGVVLPPALLGGYIASAAQIAVPTPSEQAVVAFKDADPNSIDVFYVDMLFAHPPGAFIPVPGTSVPRFWNLTGNRDFQNFIVLPSRRNGRRVLTLGHEIMHILLNQGHPRGGGDPSTALFHTTEDHKRPDSTKRIGPYPDAQAAGVGQRDTETIRSTVENLPS
jgi:hypothetical protein